MFEMAAFTKHEPRRRRHGRKVGLLLRARRRPKQERSEGGCQGDKGEVAPTVLARIVAVAFATVASVGDGA
jgi:hypothetical protein